METEKPAELATVRERLMLPAGRLPQKTLVLFCGLPGTGKSHLARQLAARLPFVVVSSDEIRLWLFPEPRQTPEEHAVVHRTCHALTEELLDAGHSVIVDATNCRHRHRERYYRLAERCGARLMIVQTTAAPDVVRARLEKRKEGLLESFGSRADWEIYRMYIGQMEPIRRPHRVVDTSGDVTPAVEELAATLLGTPVPVPTRARVRLILNPAAGQGYRLADLDEPLGFLVRHGWEVGLWETHRPREAIELARRAAAEGMDLVIAVGGDGTVNEVVNGLAGTPTALAVLPFGSGNVWAREQGLPLEPGDAARALIQGQIRSADLGLAGERYFLLMAGVGFDAAVVRALSDEGRQPLWPLGSILKGITMALNFSGKETVITLDDRQQVTGETLLVVIGNTRLYGGLVQITAHASIDDGLLDICVFRGKGGFSQLSQYALATVLQLQEHTSGVDYYRAREISIASQTPLYVQADGEPIGTTPMTFRNIPRALRVLVPPSVPPYLFSQS
ncbi:MAG: YegS/Rv2252/BmrU family lipid kinase [Chloroflexia bacterium]